MARELHRASIDHGYASEPTTPPEMREQSYGSSVLSGRTNRYSTSSFTSPPPNARSSRSGSQLTSPPADLLMFASHQDGRESLPSRSVPNSRRGSTDRVSAFVPETNGSARRNGLSNRYSMPVSSVRAKTYEAVPEHSPNEDIEQVNTTSFLFDEDEKPKDSVTSPEIDNYLTMGNNNFPVLNDHNGTLSAASAALDLALTQSPTPEKGLGSIFSKNHRLSLQHSVSGDASGHPNGQSNTYGGMTVTNSTDQNFRQPNRHSMEASLAAYSQQQGSGTQLVTTESSRPSLASSHASYSTNDVPTLKDTIASTNVTPPKNHSQQFHNHNASLGRIPAYAVSNRQSRDLATVAREDTSSTFQPMHVNLSTSSASTIPASASSPTETSPRSSATISANGSMSFANQPFYAGYGMQLANLGVNPILANQLAYTNPMQLVQQQHQQQQQNPFLPYTNFAQQSRFQDGQPRSMQNRRMPHMDDQARFSNVKLESLRGEIPSLCKDQHGCRYLQKKLEDRQTPENVQIIFLETYQHVVELMTGKSKIEMNGACLRNQIPSATTCAKSYWSSRMMSSERCW